MRSPNNCVIALLTLAILSCKKNTKNEVSKEAVIPAEIVEFNPNPKASYFDTIIDDKTVKL